MNPNDPPGVAPYDIGITINSSRIPSTTFYDYTDSFTNMNNRTSFKSVLIHEIYHGLGFFNRAHYNNISNAPTAMGLYNTYLFRSSNQPTSLSEFQESTRPRIGSAIRNKYEIQISLSAPPPTFSFTATLNGSSDPSWTFVLSRTNQTPVPKLDFNSGSNNITLTNLTLDSGTLPTLSDRSVYIVNFLNSGLGSIPLEFGKNGVTSVQLTSDGTFAALRFASEDWTLNSNIINGGVDSITNLYYGNIFHNDGLGYQAQIQNETTSHYSSTTNLMHSVAQLGGTQPSAQDIRVLELLGYGNHALICIHPDVDVFTREEGWIKMKELRSGMFVRDYNGDWVRVKRVVKSARTNNFVRVRKNTFGVGSPRCDFYATPDHSLLHKNKIMTFSDLVDEFENVKAKLVDPVPPFSIITDDQTFVDVSGLMISTWTDKSLKKEVDSRHKFIPLSYQ